VNVIAARAEFEQGSRISEKNRTLGTDPSLAHGKRVRHPTNCRSLVATLLVMTAWDKGDRAR